MPNRHEGDDLVTALRRATAARHRRLDGALAIARAPLTRERYAAFLRGSLRVLQALEPALSRWPQAYGASLRIECLRADLRSIGAAHDPAPADVKVPETVAEAFGAAYVVEGSALGGRVLAPLVQRALGDSAPVTYLRLRGDATQAHWQQWLGRLHAFDEQERPGDRDAACAMACSTFDAYTRALAAATRVAA